MDNIEYNKPVKNFKTVLKYLNTIPNINCGGCAISAYSIYKWLEKHNKLKPDTCIYYLYKYYSFDLYEQNAKYLANIEDNATSCSHAVIYHNGKYYDAEGKITKEEMNTYISEKTEVKSFDFLLKSINNINIWNPIFKRSNIKQIQKKLKIDLSEIIIN